MYNALKEKTNIYHLRTFILRLMVTYLKIEKKINLFRADEFVMASSG